MKPTRLDFLRTAGATAGLPALTAQAFPQETTSAAPSSRPADLGSRFADVEARHHHSYRTENDLRIHHNNTK